MSGTAEPASADKASGATARSVMPLRANWVTRGLYCLALLALVFGSMGQARSWAGLATQATIVSIAGPVGYVLVSVALLYRAYHVIVYPAALDARPPYLLGRLVRWLGWLIMLVGAIGVGAMFLMEPLTLLIYKTAAARVVGSFVVGLYAGLAAGAGWVGCLLFDISRGIGRRLTPHAAARTRRQRILDVSVLASLAVLVVALPAVFKLMNGEPCSGPTLGRCAAKVEGGPSRMATAAVGALVALESDIDEIEYRHPAEPAWVLREHPGFSLLKSGHPVTQGAEAGVKVAIHAVTAGEGVVITLTVSEGGRQTARFTTHFESGARIEPSAAGSRKVVVELKKNVSHPLASQLGDMQAHLLDEVYHQMRTAIGSEREVAQQAIRVEAEAIPVGTSELPASVKIGDARPAPNCASVLKIRHGDAETELTPDAGGYRSQAIFLSPQEPTVLVHPNDRVSCHGSAVWFAAQLLPGRSLQIRKFSPAATLERHLLVSLPQRAAGEYEFVDETSFAERDGQIEFAVFVGKSRHQLRLERFKIKL